jgi:hypothetical protein
MQGRCRGNERNWLMYQQSFGQLSSLPRTQQSDEAHLLLTHGQGVIILPSEPNIAQLVPMLDDMLDDITNINKCQNEIDTNNS